MDNKVTVVIPNYNGRKYLGDCLGALYSQEEGTPAFQVVLVDNGSTDGSVEWIREHSPRTQLLCFSENTGFCGAVNAGIRASLSPYIILLNNDTKVKPGFVKALVLAMERDDTIFSVSAKMLMWDDPGRIDDAGDRFCALGWAYARGKGKAAGRYDRPAEVFSACGGAAIYRREILDRIGLFDELHFAYLEDVDIGYRARIFGYRSFYEPAAQVVHYGSAASGSRYNAFKTGLVPENNIYLIAKNMPLLQWLWNLPLLALGFLVKILFFSTKGMGILYLKGIIRGFQKASSARGRACKVRFCWNNLGHYLAIQGQLYLNILRFIMKS